MNAPTFATPRLTLRGHVVDDLADCAAMWADPRVTRHIGGRPFTREEVWSKVLFLEGAGGVATGAKIVSAQFDIPSTIAAGPATLFVVANGIPSVGVSVTIL